MGYRYRVKNYDLIIVGAGIVGTACADYASQEGLRVAIVEPGPIGGGATAAAMGHLVAMDDDPAELALAHYSLNLWDAFTGIEQIEYSRCGTLWIAGSEAEYACIPEKIARLAAVDVQAELIDSEQLYRLEPHLRPGLRGGIRPAWRVICSIVRVRALLSFIATASLQSPSTACNWPIKRIWQAPY
jgi:D-hydroxyproline dehydrogenase subunit beta